jgi:hypothetical protein
MSLGSDAAKLSLPGLSGQKISRCPDHAGSLAASVPRAPFGVPQDTGQNVPDMQSPGLYVGLELHILAEV